MRQYLISSMTAPSAAQFGAHPVVQRAQLVLGNEAARHAGLIGEEEHEVSGRVEPADRLRRVRHPANPVLGAHVAVVVVDDPIAVEEGGGRGTERAESMPLIFESLRASWSVRSRRRSRERQRDEFAGPPAYRRSRYQQMIAKRAQCFALAAGETNGDEPRSLAVRSARQNVRRTSEVDNASSTSPRAPSPSTCRANTCSKP